VAVVAIQVHIQRRSVEDSRINQVECLPGSGYGFASKVGQHVFDHHAHQHFVLDNKDPPTGKQLSIKSICWCGKGHRTDQAVRPVVEINRAFRFMVQTALDHPRAKSLV
jgi:hypothetical protein